MQINEEEMNYFMGFVLSWAFHDRVPPKYNTDVLQNTVASELQYWTDACKVFSPFP